MSMLSPALASNPPSYDARTMTAGQTFVRIALDEQIYTLRITKAGKLILTK